MHLSRSPGIPYMYELLDKHNIDLRRWNIATHEIEVGDTCMEAEIVTFVVKESTHLNVPLD